MTIRYSPAALADLRTLRDYLTDAFGTSVAQETLAKILTDIHALETFPALARPLSDKINRPTGYLYLLSGRLSIIILRKSDDTISVIRILDTRSDYISEIFSE